MNKLYDLALRLYPLIQKPSTRRGKLMNNKYLLLSCFLLQTACTGGASSNEVVAPLTTDSPSVAAKTTNLSVGDLDCPYGGILVETGIDFNKNGLLDSVEVSNRQKVCNGATGAIGFCGR